MIVFAGSHAIVTCPGGPRVQTYIGRRDSSTMAPPGLLPDVNAPADSLFKLFQDKGFDAVDLAALLGAHSTSNQFNFNTSAEAYGLPQDSTPGKYILSISPTRCANTLKAFGTSNTTPKPPRRPRACWCFRATPS